MTPASELRQAVIEAGGSLDASVRGLRDHFGIRRLTPTGRQRMEEELRRVGIKVRPALDSAGLDDIVQLVDTSTPAKAEVAERAHRPRKQAEAPKPEPESRNRRRWVLLLAALAVLTLAVGSAALLSAGDDASSGSSTTAITTERLAEPPFTRSDAIRQVALARRAVADDRPSDATALLAVIPAALISAEADLGERLRETRRLILLTRRYLRGVTLANDGRYLAARDAMVAVAPFRDARRRAEEYKTAYAKTLISEAREFFRDHPRVALSILDRAERYAPGDPEITALRTTVEARQAELEAPPEPDPYLDPAPIPDAPSFNPLCLPQSACPGRRDGDGDGCYCE